jgi:ubiquinone/menaquinone biosynthesis C-methylase UbiE
LSNKENSIHDFSVQTIVDYFANVQRQGPGSTEMTKKALSFVNSLNENSVIADIGSGTGEQTRVIAENTPARQIIGVDLFPTFIDLFNKNSKELGLQDRVKGIVESMDNLSFDNEQLDLMWSEGAIYNIGFENGLRLWNKFIKPGGYVAVTEVSWFTEKRPDEITEFWNDAYPGIDTIPNKVAQMQNAGYIPVASFILPEECWTTNFHIPQEPVQEEFLKLNAGNKEAEGFIANQRHEARLYKKYKDYYSYVFYIGRK